MNLKDFGIEKELTTHEYVLWLETPEGKKFLEKIESPMRSIGNYWTMHAAKSLVITKYAMAASNASLDGFIKWAKKEGPSLKESPTLFRFGEDDDYTITSINNLVLRYKTSLNET
ncbi:MAG: hypothetical protein WCW04_00610 [Candidatus Paceibacterota bacterium]